MSLRFEKISISRKGRTVLDGLSGQLPSTGIVGLIGRNGSGKTTLLECLTGYLSPEAGAIFWGDCNLTALTHAKRMENIAYLPQAESLYFPIRVKQYLALSLPHSIEESELEQHSLIAELQLASLLDSWMHELSGGERQRVRLGQTFLSPKKLTLLDEPFNFLDHWQSKATQQFLLSRAQEQLLCLVLHDLELARELCDYVLLLSAGKIISQGTPQEVLSPANLTRVREAS